MHRRHWSTVLTVYFGWVWFCLLIESVFDPFVYAMVLVLPGVIWGMSRYRRGMFRNPLIGGLFAVLLMPGIWLGFTGFQRSRRDLEVFLVSIAFAIVLVWAVRFRPTASPFRPSLVKNKDLIVFLIATSSMSWLVTSWLDSRTSFSASKVNLERFKTLHEHSRWPHVRLGIALSGGGYRAALVHSGVVRFLEHQGAELTHISSVSGGSIFASYYELGREPDDIRAMVEAGGFNLQRHLVDFPTPFKFLLAAKMPGVGFRLNPFYAFDRSQAQAELLDRAFLGGQGWPTPERQFQPRLMIAATDLFSAQAIGFTSSGIFRRQLTPVDSRDDFRNKFSDDAEIPVQPPLSNEHCLVDKASTLVAASGAIPGLLNAVSISCKWGTTDFDMRLVDGGVIDNSGTQLLIGAGNVRPTEWGTDLILESDAGEMLAPLPYLQQFTSDIGEVTRSLDILYEASEVHRYSLKEKRPSLFLISPAALLDGRLLADKTLGVGVPVNELVGLNFLKAVNHAALANVGHDAFSFITDGMERANPQKEIAQKLALKCCTREDDLTLSNSVGWFPLVKDHELVHVLEDYFKMLVKAFDSTKTPDSTIPPEKAKQLVRLGEFLAAIAWPDIQVELDSIEAKRTAAAIR
jgi:predicted acylesterase/phospholipase RssA